MPTKAEIGMVNGLQAALDAKFSAANKPAVSDVNGLQTSLDGKVSPCTAVALVTGSRALGTTYQNTSPTKNMLVAVTVSPAASSIIDFELSIDGTNFVPVGTHSNTDRRTISAVVPPGWRYRVKASSGSATLNSWAEVS